MIKIKKSELLKKSLFADSVMIEVQECHPKQLVNNELPIPIWKFKYNYTTKRNNQKTAVKYIIGEEQDYDRIDDDFMTYIERENEEHPERKVSNVEILDSEYLGKLYIKLE